MAFPASSIPSGTTHAVLKVSGTYFVSSPSLSVNWALSFRSRKCAVRHSDLDCFSTGEIRRFPPIPYPGLYARRVA
jgi:hypothetical protein